VFSVKDKVIFISGGNRGLGRGIATGLAGNGARVVIAARDLVALKKTRDCILANGHSCFAVEMDVTSTGSVQRAVDSAQEMAGAPIEVLINNAGMTADNIKAEEMTEKDWLRVMDVNLNGYFRLAQAAVGNMIAKRAGKIINMSSVLGISPVPLGLPYCVSKGAVNHLTKAWAIEWSRYNVQVNAIAPAYIMTDMNKERLENESFRQKVLSRIPAGRLGNTQDLIGAVLFLASEASNYVTGIVLPVDGGWCAA
jgi:NAD(P)-dependent dehydrogenase (short-subunit alcohol dehydrogenase family)